MITADFLLTSLIVVLMPGTGVMYMVSTGLFLGARASLFAAVGCTAGILPHLAASVLGLAAILHMSALAFQMLKLAGAAYLLYIAWMTWQQRGLLAVDGPAEAASLRGIVAKAFLLNILNPKLSIFFLAFLPQFVKPGGEAAPSLLSQMLVLSAVFMAMTFGVFVVYGLLAHAFRAAVIDSPRVQTWLRRGFAAAFAGLGLNLAMTER